MKSRYDKVLIALACLAAAALLRFWVGPLSERLPTDYKNEVNLSEENQFRDSPTGEWQAGTLTVQRIDQVITNSGQTAFIQGSLQIHFTSGELNFESSGLYGVDRLTRQNLAGYGDVNRSGQYFFPPHVKQSEYQIWDPMFIGQRQAIYERTEQMEGLTVYVFSFSASGLEETAGYSTLPDVPEHYLAYTDGQGTIWIEPVSGIMVDYMDSGLSYFVDPSTGKRVADFNQWEERYTPETRAAQIKLARAARLRILALELWLPGGLALAGLVILASGISGKNRVKRAKP